MPYQISRNGQTYGPYTFEDLKRYVASGNVLPTDLAKSEEMAEWLPVSQILDTSTPVAAAAPFGESAYTASASPQAYGSSAEYSPAVAGANLAASPYSDGPNLHWGLYLLFAVITCTLFSKVFTVIQAVWLKKVQPNSNGLIFYIGLYVFWVVIFIINAGHSAAMIMHAGQHTQFTNPGHGALSILYLVLLIVTRFVMSASMEEHFNGPEPIGLKMNPAAVFFFGGVYFQYKINEINAMKQAGRYGTRAY